MILVDSNVFLIDLRYPRGANAPTNARFLAEVKARGDGATSILCLLEVLGVLSFNLNEPQLRTLFRQFSDRYGVAVLPSAEPDTPLPRWTAGRLAKRVASKLSLGDAMIIEHAETMSPPIQTLVSWEGTHFLGKTRLDVLTPAQFLER